MNIGASRLLKNKMLNKTLDFKDINNPKAKQMIGWFEDKYKVLSDKGIPVRRDGMDNYNRRYWEYYWTTENTPLNPDSYIMDLGCGASIFPFYLSDYYKSKVLGVDKGEEAIKECKEQVSEFNNQDVKFKCVDILTTDIPKDTFDAIFSISVIEHIVERDKCIFNCLNLLKPGGYLSLTFDYHKMGRSLSGFSPSGYKLCYDEVIGLINKFSFMGLTLRNNGIFHDNADYNDLPIGKSYTFGSLFFQKNI